MGECCFGGDDEAKLPTETLLWEYVNGSFNEFVTELFELLTSSKFVLEILFKVVIP